jgi:hypothetical protein
MPQIQLQMVNPKQNGGSYKLKTFDFSNRHNFVLDQPFEIWFQALYSTKKDLQFDTKLDHCCSLRISCNS